MSRLINSFYSLSAGVSGCCGAACKQFFTVTNLERPSDFPNTFSGCLLHTICLSGIYKPYDLHAFPSSVIWLLSCLEKVFWNLNVNRCGRVYEGMQYRNMANFNLLAYIFFQLTIKVKKKMCVQNPVTLKKSFLINTVSN